MKEDIKILEDYIKLINKGYCDDCNELCNIYGTPAFPSRAISKAIENLIKGFKKIKIENIKYQMGQMPDTTEEYKNLKKELEKWKNGEM